MKYGILPFTLLLALAPAPALAGVGFQLNIGIQAGAPPLAPVGPGVQVLEGCPEEVFFSAGWYWCRRPDGWYRARGLRDRFDWVDARHVPHGMMLRPAGYYRDWHRPGGRGYGRGPEHGRRGWRGRGPEPGR